jgi:HNH endonuclease
LKTIVELPPTEYLRSRLRYNKRTGVLTWRKRPIEHFYSAQYQKRWNTRYADKPAFTSTTKKGYKSGAIDKRLFQAHRVIWKLVTGKDPVDLIDHKDNDGSNNRWKNIREATNGQNMLNMPSRRSRLDRGVQQTRDGKWAVFIFSRKNLKYLGRFARKADAIAVRRKAELKYHGEFA